MIIALATLAIFSVIVKTDGSFAALEYSHNEVARPGDNVMHGNVRKTQ